MGLWGCTPLPPGTLPGQQATQDRPETAQQPSQEQAPELAADSTIDFADAFEAEPIAQTPPSVEPQIDSVIHSPELVRVLLVKKNRLDLYLYTQYHFAENPQKTLQGAIQLRAGPAKSVDFLLRGQKIGNVAAPCTLLTLPGAEGQFQTTAVHGDRAYRGNIILDIDPYDSNTILLINYLELEEYIKGVVPHELGVLSTREIEALKAQAVASRTYAYRKILERKNDAFDLQSTVADQVYGGILYQKPHTNRAVEQTRGMIMVYRAKPIIAYYHSTCGGKTAEVHQVWDKPPQPYLKSIEDTDPLAMPWCRISKAYRWEYSWSAAQLQKLLSNTLSLPAARAKGRWGGSFVGASIKNTFSCGRVSELHLNFKQGTAILSGDAIRFALRRGDSSDDPILRSSRFSIVSAGPEGLSLKGSGFGHGVGMCQMGAIARSRAGQDFRQILAAYYAKTTLVQLNGRN